MPLNGVGNMISVLLAGAEEKASSTICRYRHVFCDCSLNDLLCGGRHLTWNVLASARSNPFQVDF